MVRGRRRGECIFFRILNEMSEYSSGAFEGTLKSDPALRKKMRENMKRIGSDGLYFRGGDTQESHPRPQRKRPRPDTNSPTYTVRPEPKQIAKTNRKEIKLKPKQLAGSKRPKLSTMESVLADAIAEGTSHRQRRSRKKRTRRKSRHTTRLRRKSRRRR